MLTIPLPCGIGEDRLPKKRYCNIKTHSKKEINNGIRNQSQLTL
jgi:hypothetical protein